MDDAGRATGARTTPTGPTALAKLELLRRASMAEVAEREPLVTDDELDEDVSELDYSLERVLPRQLTGRARAAARASTAPCARSSTTSAPRASGARREARPAASLIRQPSASSWPTSSAGPATSRARPARAPAPPGRAAPTQLEQVYAEPRDASPASWSRSPTLVTALAMNHVHRGSVLAVAGTVADRARLLRRSALQRQLDDRAAIRSGTRCRRLARRWRTRRPARGSSWR